MSLRVLGLDPGTATFGWGVVESDGERLVATAGRDHAIALERRGNGLFRLQLECRHVLVTQ